MSDDQTYLNPLRKQLQREIHKSTGNHPASIGRQHFEFSNHATHLHKALGQKHYVVPEMDTFKRSFEEMPTPSETTGVGRAQAAGIERQRKNMFNLMDKVRQDIEADIGHGRYTRDD